MINWPRIAIDQAGPGCCCYKLGVIDQTHINYRSLPSARTHTRLSLTAAFYILVILACFCPAGQFTWFQDNASMRIGNFIADIASKTWDSMGWGQQVYLSHNKL